MDKKSIRTILPSYKSYVSNVGEGYRQQDDENAVYGFINSNGSIQEIDYHTCFGRLQGLNNRYSDVDPVAIVVQMQTMIRDDLDHSDFVKKYSIYYEWLLNYSPWRSAYVTKNVSRIMRDRVVVLDTEVEANFMAGAAIALRHPWESYGYGWDVAVRFIMDLWLELVNNGVDPTSAFVFANQMCGTKNKVALNSTAVGHQSLDCYHGQKYIHANFIEGITKDGVSYRKAMNYGGSSEAFNVSRRGEKTVPLHGFIKDRLVDKGKKEVNPFLREVEVMPTHTMDKIVGRFKEIIPEYEQAIKGAA